MLAAELAAASAPKFYNDDPLWSEPKPVPVSMAAKREIVEQYEFFRNTFKEPYREERREGAVPRAQNANTMDEVPDCSWYTNRFGTPGWWLNGRLLKKQTFGFWQIKLLNFLIPFARPIDRFLPFPHLSWIVILRAAPETTASPSPVRANETA